MQDIVADASAMLFDIEIALNQQLGAHPLPFPGMDKAGSAICTYSMVGRCGMGAACPFRHLKGDRSVVCKHWLRGLCKKGDDCEFLHEYDLSKMPECYFYTKFGKCGNKECPFLHIDPESKMKDCAWYDRGFCRHGPNCKNRHVRRVMCQNYQCGLCLHGAECKYQHPKFDLPTVDQVQSVRKVVMKCHYCNEQGHKAFSCPRLTPSKRGEAQAVNGEGGESETPSSQHPLPQRRPLDQVTCYKCGGRGHYANKCPKGHLAFLSSTAFNRSQVPEPTGKPEEKVSS